VPDAAGPPPPRPAPPAPPALLLDEGAAAAELDWADGPDDEPPHAVSSSAVPAPRAMSDPRARPDGRKIDVGISGLSEASGREPVSMGFQEVVGIQMSFAAQRIDR